MKFNQAQRALYKKNKKLFTKHFPGLGELLDKDIPQNIELYDQDGEIDIVINGSRFYGMDAKKYSEKQIVAFTEKPGVFEMNSSNVDVEKAPTHHVWMKKYQKRFAKDIVYGQIDRVRIDVSSTFMFGIGLGFHIYPLVANSRCRSLVIQEPEPIFLKISCYFIDWTELFKILKGRIIFSFDRDAEVAFWSMRWGIHFHNPGVQQCLFYYQHYWDSTINSCYQYFCDNVRLFFDGLGYFDDEKTMMRNHLLNAYMDDWVMCSQSPRPRQASVVIVGAGPSLKNDLEWLKENRKDLIIFSAGSSLQAILRAGLIPDFHVEIENIALNYDIISPLFEEYDLSTTILICSSTMDTRASRLFSRRIWFMREGVTATMLHGDNELALEFQNPTVVNTALSAAITIGFRNILLLGADFGTRDESQHHVEGTSYETLDQLKTAVFKFPNEVPGNFGGVCYTNEHMLNGIRNVKRAVEKARVVRVFNGSDGAAVTAVPAIRAKRFKFEVLGLDKEEIINDIYETSRHRNWAEDLGVDLFDVMKKDFSEYCAVVRKNISKYSRKNKDFLLFLMESYNSLYRIEGYISRYNASVTGSYSSITLVLLYWWRRVSEDKRVVMEKIGRRYMQVFINVLERDFSKFIDEVRQELPLVRPELFDDKGNLIVEAKSSAQNAE